MTADRLDDLATRYYHGRLTAAEVAELSAAVRDSADARRAVADLAVLAVGLAEQFPRPARAPRRRWRAAGLVAAAGLAGAVAGWVGVPAVPAAAAVIERPVGRVLLGGRPLADGAQVLAGQVVSTVGAGSVVTLRCSDGSRLVLTPDTTVTLGAGGRPTVALDRGDLAADVPARDGDDPPFTIATPDAAAVAGPAGANLSVGLTAGQTEVGVVEGHVRVTRPEGGPPLDVAGGELGTVAAAGPARKRALPRPPDEYAWDLARPLPRGWGLGRVVPGAGPGGPPAAVKAEFWDDPFIHMRASQIRSNNAWTRGLCALYPDSRIGFRYRVDRRPAAGAAQFLLLVRSDRLAREGIVIELPGGLPCDRPGEWQAADLAGADMRPEHPVTRPLDFGPPWVVHWVIFNTYDDDLGLQVADFRITRPVRPGG